MGNVQDKPPLGSTRQGREKLKLENEVTNGGIVSGRRSMGQRYLFKDFRSLLKHELPVHNNSGFGSDGRGSGASDDGKWIVKEGERKAGSNARDEERKAGHSETASGTSGSGDGEKGDGNVLPRISMPVQIGEGEMVDGWPKWLIDNIPREVLTGLIPKSAESYDMLDKVGQGTYSNVYKARDKDTRKIVALKKVHFETSDPESVKFMAREIMILRKLDHPNVVKLEGLATSRMHYSIYLVFDFMQSDLARIISRPNGRLTEPQVKCYMRQLLSGLQHCHERGILHRDIKGSNLLIDENGVLKIADFGLANYYTPSQKHTLTSRVVTLWYRAPELLLGATNYGVGIDLWSVGCLLAEMFTGEPIMPGRTEVEQLHRIFKLCGTPSAEYWKKLRVPTAFKLPLPCKPIFLEAFRDFPVSSLGLLKTLLALDSAFRGSASSALQNEFFYSSPLACDLSGLPVIYKEEDEPTQSNDRKKHRKSKMRQRSRTQRERRSKDLAAEKPKTDLGTSKEVAEKSAEPNIHSQEKHNSTSSASSSAKPIHHRESSPQLLFALESTQRLSPRTLNHPNASMNIKNLPPLPTLKTSSNKHNKGHNDLYRSNHVYRSASTRGFQKLEQRKQWVFSTSDD